MLWPISTCEPKPKGSSAYLLFARICVITSVYPSFSISYPEHNICPHLPPGFKMVFTQKQHSGFSAGTRSAGRMLPGCKNRQNISCPLRPACRHIIIKSNQIIFLVTYCAQELARGCPNKITQNALQDGIGVSARRSLGETVLIQEHSYFRNFKC